MSFAVQYVQKKIVPRNLGSILGGGGACEICNKFDAIYRVEWKCVQATVNREAEKCHKVTSTICKQCAPKTAEFKLSKRDERLLQERQRSDNKANLSRLLDAMKMKMDYVVMDERLYNIYTMVDGGDHIDRPDIIYAWSKLKSARQYKKK